MISYIPDQSERVKRASFGIGCVKGRQIQLFGPNDLWDGWTNLGETFRDYLGHAGEWPREIIFLNSWKRKRLKFLDNCVGFVKDDEEGGKVALAWYNITDK